MRILALDIGTGTQDILLFDSATTPENSLKMVMPSPTVIVERRIRQATVEGMSIVLSGVTMGGGPCAWAIGDHVAAGGKVFATADAARTLNDDLDEVRKSGIDVIDEGDAAHLAARSGARAIEMRDLDLAAIRRALEAFGVDPRVDALAIAVFDHGAAPPGVSDRLFRFEYLRRTVERQNGLEAFVYLASEVPDYMTRMRAVISCVDIEAPVLMMDTCMAAALGALEDPKVRAPESRVIVNVGNFHTLAFHLRGGAIEALFEHHSGFLNTQKLDGLIEGLIDGSLTNETVFDDMGHGCFVLSPGDGMPLVAVTGPKRGLTAGSRLSPYYAVPHGDMMLSGSYGLVRACAWRFPHWREEIEASLARGVG